MRRAIFEILITHSDNHGLGEVIYSCGHYGREYLHDLPLDGNCELCDCETDEQRLDKLNELVDRRKKD